jgi:hypothetical protein
MKNGGTVGIKLMVETMDHAPESLTWRELWVLGVLAEDANDKTRECWPGFEGESEKSRIFRARVRCSRSQYYATIKSLVEKKAIEPTRRGQKHVRAQFRILPMTPPQGPGFPDAEDPFQGPVNRDADGGLRVPVSDSQGPGFRFSGSRFEALRVPVSGTPTPQSPQIPSSLSPADLVHAAAVVPPDEERDFINWIIKRHNPASAAWWRKVAENNDLPALASAWRTTRPAPSTAPSGRCTVHLLELPCRSCAADAKAAN